MKITFLLLLLLPVFVKSQHHRLTVSVEDIPNPNGNISIGIYNSADGFLKVDKACAGTFVKAIQGKTKIHFEDLPNGTYAVAIFYDENGNEKLDTNFLGIPKEKVAFSKAKMKTFGPPSFLECSFEMISDMDISIGW